MINRKLLALVGMAVIAALATACNADPTPTPQPSLPTPTTPSDSAGGFDWSVEEVDRGIKPAIALDSAGVPYVTYMLEALDGFVNVARKPNGS